MIKRHFYRAVSIWGTQKETYVACLYHSLGYCASLPLSAGISEVSVFYILIPTKEKFCDSYFVVRGLDTVIGILYCYQISLLTSLVLVTLFMMIIFIGQILIVMNNAGMSALL